MKIVNCCVCGKQLNLAKEKYIIEKSVPFQTDNIKEYDALDCDYCGCQNVLNIRYPRICKDSEVNENE